MKLNRFALMLIAVTVVAVAPTVWAYPEKNVQYIIPFVPGGESDVMARWQQVVFRKNYKHDLIVVNKPGAGGGLAWSQLNGLSADGGFEVVDIPVDKNAAFVKERSKEYLEIAKRMGLVK
ncbi:MAG: hypothetical protein A3F74_01145 [Betaproteobacteria bacterium RIFCSPLOWO2_12_FULL_62_58]|nr:MAG: hypothetical protein A3F74_01145 [Betaproteobacteria bacterium RIFCSPLOWO2_12_FULL_62_58]